MKRRGVIFSCLDVAESFAHEICPYVHSDYMMLARKLNLLEGLVLEALAYLFYNSSKPTLFSLVATTDVCVSQGIVCMKNVPVDWYSIHMYMY